MKKILLALSLGIAGFCSTSVIGQAAEGIKMPLINGGHSNYDKVVGNIPMSKDGLNVLILNHDDYYEQKYAQAYVMNLESGNIIKDFGKGYEFGTIINDDATYYVYSGNDNDGYKHSVQPLKYSSGFDERVKLGIKGDAKGFLKRTNTFIYSDYEGIHAFNLDTKKEVFSNPVGTYQMIKVGPDIAVVRDDSITILNSSGEFKEVLEFNSKINSVAYTQDGTKLLVATENEDVKVYNTTNYELSNITIPNTKDIEGLVVDGTNSYLATTSKGYFRLYNFKNGDRIYSEKDDLKVESDEIALSDGAKYMLIGSNVYSGKNINTYIQSIALTNNVLQLGQRYTPTVEVTYANGEKEIVTEGVTWKANNMDVAYMDTVENKLVASHLGEVDVLVNYLDFSLQQTFKVVDTEKPIFSGVTDITAYSNLGVDELQGIKATDVGDGDLTEDIQVSGNFDPNVAGKYNLTYTVKDTAGNEATAQRMITIKYNPTKNMHLYDTDFDTLYFSKNLYNKNFKALKLPTVMTYVDTQNGIESGFGVEIKTTKKQTIKKLKISANGKTWSKALSGSYMTAKNTESVFKALTEKDRKWFKANIDATKKVKATIVTKKKTINKTFTSKELQGLLDGVYMYDYLKDK